MIIPQQTWIKYNTKIFVLKLMKDQFQKKRPPKRAHLGGLFFDEMKIQEGLVFDSKNWELIGFRLIFRCCCCRNKEQHAGYRLATHVLQFFFRSTLTLTTHVLFF